MPDDRFVPDAAVAALLPPEERARFDPENAASIARVAARLAFDEDHGVERGPARRGSIKQSHRAEGRNFID